MISLTTAQKDTALKAALVVLVAVLVYLLASSGSLSFGGARAKSFHKLPLAYKLTQKKAIDLSVAQMNGTEPLQRLEIDTGLPVAEQFEPPTLSDIVLSMQEDCTTRRYDGVCAMNYNIPVSVCFMPALGSERHLVMYNLKMAGYSRNVTQADETSLLCDKGQTNYGYERFKFVWIEFWDQNLDYHYMKMGGRMGRVVQHLAWLNRGVTVCDPMSAQQQANVLFQVMNEFTSVNMS